MNRDLKLLVLLFMLMPVLLPAQKDYFGVFWQGFAQDWTYNHRMNRLTDFVRLNPEKSPMTLELCHAAASGTGTDSAFYTQNAILLRTPNAKFYPGSVEINLETKEKKVVSNETKVNIPYPAPPEPGTQAFVLLNGFDLVSTARADKLIEWSVLPGEKPEWSADSGWTFSFLTRLEAACSTPECELFYQKVSYKLVLYYQFVVAGPEVSGHPFSVENSWEWDKKKEFHPSMIDFAVKGKYPEAANVVGFRGFSLRMDQEHWIQQMGMRIVKTKFDPKSQSLAGLMDCSWVEWTHDRKSHEEFRKFNRFSLKHAGQATFSAEMLWLQFPEGRTERFSNRGSLLWPGRNAPALGSEVECKSFEISVD